MTHQDIPQHTSSLSLRTLTKSHCRLLHNTLLLFSKTSLLLINRISLYRIVSHRHHSILHNISHQCITTFRTCASFCTISPKCAICTCHIYLLTFNTTPLSFAYAFTSLRLLKYVIFIINTYMHGYYR